jgi:multiple sugar transport system substrate-binding protein
MKRVLSILLSLLLVLGLLVGCSGDKSTPGKDATGSNGSKSTDDVDVSDELKPITITVAMWPAENDEAGLELKEKQLEIMKEKYPHITVVPERWAYDVKSFLPKAESGQLATVYSTYFTEPQKIIGGGYAADITQNMKDYGYDQAISAELLELVTRDDVIYGIPDSAYTMGVHYNVNLMKEAGLVDDSGKPMYAKTWDELLDFAKTIKEKTGQAGFSLPTINNQGGWQFLNIAWGFGGDFEEQDADGNWKAVFNSPEVVKAMEWVKDLKWVHDVLPANNLLDIAEQNQYFAADQLGMKLRDVGAANEMVVNFDMDKDNLAMSAMPGGPAGAYAQMGGGIIMFSPNATYEEIDACFKWLEVTGFSDKTTDEDLENLENSLKANAEAGRIVGPYGVPPIWAQSERFEAEQALREKHKNVDLSLYADYLMSADKVTVNPEPPVNCQEMYKLIDNVIQAMWTDKNADPKALLDKAAEDFQRDYLDPYNAQ